MRNAWKALFVRGLPRRILPIQSSRTESLNLQVRVPTTPTTSFSPSLLGENGPAANFGIRYLSSEPAFEPKDLDHAPLIEIFSRSSGSDEIKTELESANLSLDHETVNLVLRNLEESSEIARRFFGWVLEKENEKLSSKSYNIMLEILGREGRCGEFWDLVEKMKKKGFGISKRTYLEVSQSFDKEGMARDLEMLKEMYVSNSPENYVERMCPRVCKIMREEDELGEDFRRKLGDLAVRLSPDLISAVLERLSLYPDKALLFFQWVEETPSFKIDGRIYNVMARTLGREDFIEEFWEVLKELRSGRYELERETYLMVSKRFYKRKMMKEAVELYEFAMGGKEKPTAQDCLFLLRKIIVGEELNTGLISRVVRIFTEAGYAVKLKGSIFDGVLKSLASVGNLGECDKILKAMVEGDFVANSSVLDQVVIGLCNAGRLDEACNFLVEIESSGLIPVVKAWTSLVQRHSLAGETEKALSCFRKMVDRRGSENAGCAFEVLVNGFYHKNNLEDACNILAEMVDKKELQPWHSTYKFLIEKLLSQGKLKEASSLLGLMKGHGYPPFVGPFIDYISKFGNGDDAMGFLKAMTVKKFPSTSVFMCMFEAFFEAGRHEAAQDFLSKSPGYIRAHADVLELFYSRKPEEAATADAL